MKSEKAEMIEARKKELESLGVDDRLAYWRRMHNRTELRNQLIGWIGIICAFASSMLASYPAILRFTGTAAFISIVILKFSDLKTRATVFISAWHIVDKARNNYLSNEEVNINSVSEALNTAEEYIKNSLNKI